MKKQALAIAIASALAAPSAFAAQDTSGMHYTSASEGFYASIRAVWSSSGDAEQDFDGDKNQGAHIGGSFSRFGVSGTNDLGGGLEGFYGYEATFEHNQGSEAKTRLANVGLRGDFGEIVVGSFWNNLYNFSYGATDVANNYSGHFLSSGGNEGDVRDFANRTNNALQYTTPDLNGFQGSFLVISGDSNDPDATPPVTDKDGNDVDGWALAGKYDVQGFSLGASYLTNTEGFVDTDGFDGNGNQSKDKNVWTVKLGYAQDNWYVNGWYGEANDSETAQDRNAVGDAIVKNDDTEYFSLAGGVSVDKVNLYVLYEQSEQGSDKNTYGTVGVQYNLGSRSRTFVEYNDQDAHDSTTDDASVVVGLRHDF